MAVDSRKPNGSPVFLGTGAPATGDDLTTLGDEIYFRGNRIVGSTAQRNAYSYMTDGLVWFDTTEWREYIVESGQWVTTQRIVTLAGSGGSLSPGWTSGTGGSTPRILREGVKRTLFGSIVHSSGASYSNMLTVGPDDRPDPATRIVGTAFVRASTASASIVASLQIEDGLIGSNMAAGSAPVGGVVRLDGLSWVID